MTVETTDTQAQPTNLPTDMTVVDDAGKAVDVDAVIENDGKEPDTVEYPEWLPEKFKTGADWQEKLGQSYTELEKTLKEKGRIAPDEYKLDDNLKARVDPEILGDFEALAKEIKLPQEHYEKVIGWAEEVGLLDVPVFEEEMAKLGDEQKIILDTLHNYGNKYLTKEEFNILESVTTTADQVKVLYKIINSTDRQVPTKAGEGNRDNSDDMQRKLEELISNPKIKTDYRMQKDAEELAKKLSSM